MFTLALLQNTELVVFFFIFIWFSFVWFIIYYIIFLDGSPNIVEVDYVFMYISFHISHAIAFTYEHKRI